MMLLPLLLLGGIAMFAALTRNGQGTVSGGVFKTQGPSVAEFRRDRPYLYSVLVQLKKGHRPDISLVRNAMDEAYECGDETTLIKIARKFQRDLRYHNAQLEAQPDEGEEEPENENEPPDHEPDDITVGKVNASCPFDGIPEEAWTSFVASLETEKPDYETPKHVGRFHHSRERLAQLEIKDVSTAEKQYEALVADLKDLREKGSDLITEYEFQPISVGDSEQVVTLSGMLALIKSAGVENARSWLENPEDRKKFPKTSEMFLKANGAF